MEPSDKKQYVVWCLLDTRPGHRNQVLGLADALKRKTDADIQIVDVPGVVRGLLMALLTRRKLPRPSPDLIIGAGHSTHIPLVALGSRFQAKTVVLMKPTFPLSRFDLCLVPDVYTFQDNPQNLIRTTGVLNRVVPSERQDPKRGLFLVGGPCHHHHWDDAAVLEQVQQVVRRSADVNWIIAASRRTPDSFTEHAVRMFPSCRVLKPQDVEADWLPKQLSVSATVWVTADSVSMMYEAVTSGAATGVLELPKTRNNRAVQCLELLMKSEDVTSFGRWNETGVLNRSPRRICEATRCADVIVQRLLPSHRDDSTARNAA